MRTTTTASTFAALGLAALALVGGGQPAAAYDTIDCSRDHSLAERTICSSQHLQILDAKVTEAYVDFMNDTHLSQRAKSMVHESQYVFLDRRERCGADRACLAEVMQQRATRISYYR